MRTVSLEDLRTWTTDCGLNLTVVPKDIVIYEAFCTTATDLAFINAHPLNLSLSAVFGINLLIRDICPRCQSSISEGELHFH